MTNLARIMHKFSTASPKSVGLTVLRLRRPPQRTLQYACGGLGRPPYQAGAFAAS